MTGSLGAGFFMPSTIYLWEFFRIFKPLIYITLKNDVCKLVNGTLVVLVEHQSTINKNMPLRCLLYISRVYEMLVPKRERYYRKLRKIPRPEFYVLYTGIDEIDEYDVLKLSDAFDFPESDYYASPKESKKLFQLELNVPVINVKPGKNLKILENCNTLKEYSELIEKIHNLLQENDNREEVFKEAVKWGLQNGLLKGYLEQAVTEVINMLIAEYSYEEDVAAQREEAFAEGEITGAQKKAVETAKKLLSMNLSVEQVSEATGLPLEKVQRLTEELQNKTNA